MDGIPRSHTTPHIAMATTFAANDTNNMTPCHGPSASIHVHIIIINIKATIHWATLLPATRQQSCQQQSCLVDVACCPLLATKKLVASNRKNVARKLNMFNFWQQSCPNIKGRQHATSTGQLCCDNFVACCWQQSCLVDGGL